MVNFTICTGVPHLSHSSLEKYIYLAGNFSEMIDDGYIHRNLVRHMLKAGMWQEALALLVSLEWITAKLRATGPADLLSDYINMMECIGSEVRLGFNLTIIAR